MKYFALYGALTATLLMISLATAYAEDADVADVANDIESLTLEAEDVIDDADLDDFKTLEEFMVTRELEGKIKEVSDEYVVVMLEGGEELKLVVDAETLIYINDEISDISNIQTGDQIFAYYIEEGGSLKCDWVEITR